VAETSLGEVASIGRAELVLASFQHTSGRTGRAERVREAALWRVRYPECRRVIEEVQWEVTQGRPDLSPTAELRAWVAAVSAVEAGGLIEEVADSTGEVADSTGAEADSEEVAGSVEVGEDDSLQFSRLTVHGALA